MMRLGSIAASLALISCQARIFIQLDQCWPDRCLADAGDAGAVPPLPLWGDYSTALNVPACAEAPVLMVNTNSDELEVGMTLADPALAGPTLSLPEALWIAFNRPGPDSIFFDPQVFPVDAPATIDMMHRHELPQDLVQACIDARGRGVIVDWGAPDGGLYDFRSIWGVGAQSLQIGLVLLHLPSRQTVMGQIAGCRVGTDGVRLAEGPDGFVLGASGGIIGPGNVITGAVRSNGTHILSNAFHADPLTQTIFSGSAALRCDGTTSRVQDNVFQSVTLYLFRDGNVAFDNNLVGINRNGDPLPIQGPGVTISSYAVDATALIGPDNVIANAGTGIFISGDGPVTVTKNRIVKNGIGIVYSAAAPIMPPTILQLAGTTVRGTCPSAGRVEIFSDDLDQGEQLVGEVDCVATSEWMTTIAPSTRKNLTATLTDLNRRTSAFSTPYAIQ